jgi:transcription elongation factor SPT4
MSTNFVPPSQQRNLRACMVCSIVQTQAVIILHLLPHILEANLQTQRFLKEGCPNCEEFLRLQGSIDAIADCTSQVFEGLITLAEPSKSWVAKWQRLDGYVRGVYATKVSGILPEEVIDTMESEARVKYIP